MNYRTQFYKDKLEEEIVSSIKYSLFPVLAESEITFNRNNTDELIYQYVSQSTFEKVIKNNEIWATNLAYMNDSQELKDGFEILSEIIQEHQNVLKNPNERQEKFLADLKSEQYIFDIKDNDFEFSLWKEINSYLHLLKTAITLGNEDDPIHIYASCFTKNGDQLSQWRGYGRNGFSIGFDPDKLKEIVPVKKNEEKNNINHHIIELLNVEYTKEIKKEKAKYLVDSLKSNFAKIVDSDKINKDIENMRELYDTQWELKEDTIKIIAWKNISHHHLILHKILSICKDDGFKEEKEVRLVYFPNETIDNYINIRGAYIPYVVFKPKEDQKLPIKKIIISPDYANKIYQVKAGIKLLLKSSGYSETEIKSIEIIQSGIPFRS